MWNGVQDAEDRGRTQIKIINKIGVDETEETEMELPPRRSNGS
jgi:hypothetical protein